MEYPENILITGGYGCIGSQSAIWLLENTNAKVVICSRNVSDARTSKAFPGQDSDRLTCIPCDITDQSAIESILSSYQIDSVIHMAALQTPDCNSFRDLGLQINLAGTQHLVEAIKSVGARVKRLIYASSVAVYGPRAHYPQGRVPMLAEPYPVNVYGVWKLAAEHLVRLFQKETSIPTICIRPGVLFGPGRDLGLTASPTTAMKCVALRTPYEIPFCSRQDYLFAPDVGAAVGNCTMEEFEGFGVYTLPSHTLDTHEFVRAIHKASSDLGLDDSCSITVGDEEVPFICDLDFSPFIEKFPKTPQTSLESAILQSLKVFQEQVNKGLLTKKSIRQ